MTGMQYRVNSRDGRARTLDASRASVSFSFALYFSSRNNRSESEFRGINRECRLSDGRKSRSFTRPPSRSPADGSRCDECSSSVRWHCKFQVELSSPNPCQSQEATPLLQSTAQQDQSGLQVAFDVGQLQAAIQPDFLIRKVYPSRAAMLPQELPRDAAGDALDQPPHIQPPRGRIVTVSGAILASAYPGNLTCAGSQLGRSPKEESINAAAGRRLGPTEPERASQTRAERGRVVRRASRFPPGAVAGARPCAPT